MSSQQSIRVTVEKPKAAPSGVDAVIVKVAGELGINTMLGKNAKHTGLSGDTALDRALHDALPNPPQLVVLDLSAVTYLSSLAMAALVRFQKHVQSAGGQFRLAGTSSLIETLLKRCSLERVFNMYPDIPAALNVR
jgi:anti-anti-sigma factor